MQLNGYHVFIKKTSKVNIDSSVHGLPPDLGTISSFKVADYYCPDEWSQDGFFVLVEENQPLWFDFTNNPESALVCSIQRLNPVTGEPANLESGLSRDPKQNYLTLPSQRWLDGYANNGKVYQFVVTKAGEGLAVSEYVLPKSMQDSHALGFAFFGVKNPKPKVEYIHKNHYIPTSSGYLGQYPMKFSKSPIWLVDKDSVLRSKSLNRNLSHSENSGSEDSVFCSAKDVSSINCMSAGTISEVETFDAIEQNVEYDRTAMGMGGRIEQQILTDNNSVDYYKDKPDAVLTVYMCFKDQFEAIMKKGLRQTKENNDKHIFSGQIGKSKIPVPLI